MNEIIFVVEEDDGGYTARALGRSIFTEADDLEGTPPQCARRGRVPFRR